MFFYKFFTSIYYFVIRIAAVSNMKAKLMISGRKNWQKKLSKAILPNEKYIWIHAASLGEFEQGRPLIEKIKNENPENKILLSFFSSSGYEIQKNYNLADVVCYLPFDTKKNAKKFIEIVNPIMAVFVKYEFWCYYINEISAKNIPLFLISGIFKENQIFFKSYGKFYLNAIKKFTYFFLQNEESQQILAKNGITNTLVCGDTRIDRVSTISKEYYENMFFEKFAEQKTTIICGSTWAEDEKIILQFINNYSEYFNFIIVPHEISEKKINNLTEKLKNFCIKFSEIEKIDYSKHNIIIVDCIGLLSKLYRYGTVAYIGGGFGKGIHNTLEAAVYKIPIIFGPKYEKFQEAGDLIKTGAGFSINNYTQFQDTISMLMSDETNYQNIQSSLEKYFSNSLGATEKIYEKIDVRVKSREPSGRTINGRMD
ncbi:MAG: 3-deoxy-D-manno-octulosonic acid transferase [Bacteroidales bacterium]|jgi:3-deoxy-D-manno-octulosonic-acid transferase|nr:3-deoxy-D-manno-octulosonic acid transferase [Bacteroidales bacterium]